MIKTAHLTDRAVLRIAGPDAREFLQGLLTNDVMQPLPMWAGLLTAQGKYLFDMVLHDGGDAVLVDVLASRAADLAKRLTMYKLRRAVTIEAPALQVFASWGGDAAGAVDPRLAALGHRWVAGAADTNASLADYEAHRLALGVPDSADFEIDKTMWLETNAAELNGVSFTKGCYVGQENTARMHHRDKLRKRLLPVTLAGDLGDVRAVMSGDRESGALRSLHGRHGIAFLRLELLDGLSVGGAAVTMDWPTWLGEHPSTGGGAED